LPTVIPTSFSFSFHFNRDTLPSIVKFFCFVVIVLSSCVDLRLAQICWFIVLDETVFDLGVVTATTV
jgi:hypothetical protein